MIGSCVHSQPLLSHQSQPRHFLRPPKPCDFQAWVERICEKSSGCLKSRTVVLNPFVIDNASFKPNKKLRKTNRKTEINRLAFAVSVILNRYIIHFRWTGDTNQIIGQSILPARDFQLFPAGKWYSFCGVLLLCNESIIDQACLITMVGYWCSSS